MADAQPTLNIELLWFDGCPHHVAARALLDEVLLGRGLTADVRAIEVSDHETAQRTRFAGSPTIRVAGIDIDPAYEDAHDYALGCRMYATAEGLRGVPERGWIEAAVDRALAGGRGS